GVHQHSVLIQLNFAVGRTARVRGIVLLDSYFPLGPVTPTLRSVTEYVGREAFIAPAPGGEVGIRAISFRVEDRPLHEGIPCVRDPERIGKGIAAASRLKSDDRIRVAKRLDSSNVEIGIHPTLRIIVLPERDISISGVPQRLRAP